MPRPTLRSIQHAKRIKWERKVEKACLNGVSDDAWEALMAEEVTVTDDEAWRHITAPIVDQFAGEVFSSDPTWRCGWSRFRLVGAGRKPGTVRVRRVRAGDGKTQKTVQVWNLASFKSLSRRVADLTTNQPTGD